MLKNVGPQYLTRRDPLIWESKNIYGTDFANASNEVRPDPHGIPEVGSIKKKWISDYRLKFWLFKINELI